MPDTPLAKKLVLKPGYRVLLLNAPAGIRERLLPLPEGATLAETPDGAYDAVLAFVRERAELERLAPAAIGAIPAGGLLWFAYPKRSAKVTTDMTRDVGWNAVRAAGLQPVTQIAIDDVWSALRFRPAQ